MNWLQQPWLETLGWTLLHSLWQLSAIAAIAMLVLFIVRRYSSHLRYAITYTLLLLMMATTLGTYAYLWSHRPYPVAPPTSASIALPAFIPSGIAIESRPPTVLPSPPTLRDRALAALHLTAPYAASLYLAGAAFVTLRLLAGYAALRRLRASALATSDHQMLLEQLRQRLHIAKPVQLLHSPHVEVPTVFGAWRPLILLPLSTTTGLSAEHLTCLLLHELAHVRRHDYLANLAQSLIETLLFFHPAVIWLSAQIRQEREHSCDDLAIAVGSNRAQYAAALVSMESFRSSPTLALGARGGSLLRRIRRILNTPAQPPLRHRIINASSLLTTALLLTAFAFHLSACSRKTPQPLSTTPSVTPEADLVYVPGKIAVALTPATSPSPNRPACIGDIFTIVVYELLGPGQNYTDSVPVNENGNVHLLYIGDVPAVGKTPRELADEIGYIAVDRSLLRNADVRVIHANEAADLRPLQSGDLLNTEVFELEEPGKMSDEVGVVDDKGDIFVHHLDHIHVAGLTPTQAAARIATTAIDKAILHNPAYAQITRIDRNQPQISIESRIMFVDDSVLVPLQLSLAPQSNAMVMSNEDLKLFLQGTEKDQSAVSAGMPRVTVFSGQHAQLIITRDPSDATQGGMSIDVAAKLSDDHKSVQLSLRSQVRAPHPVNGATAPNETLVSNISVPSNGTVMQIGQAVDNSKPGKRRFIVLVRPKIIEESPYDKTIYDRLKFQYPPPRTQ